MSGMIWFQNVWKGYQQMTMSYKGLTCQIAIKMIILGKLMYFFNWPLLIILFADDRAKKLWNYTSLWIGNFERENLFLTRQIFIPDLDYVMTWGRFFISSTFGLTKYPSILWVHVFTGSGLITGSDRIAPDRARNWYIPLLYNFFSFLRMMYRERIMYLVQFVCSWIY